MTLTVKQSNLNSTLHSPKEKNNKNRDVSFKGPVDMATTVLCYCDKYPMLNVAAIDTVTAIAPRTCFDAKTNGFAAWETFRRESSGLIVNCLIPSFIVLGIAKALNGLFFKGDTKKLNMGSVWANEQSINTLSNYYQKADGANKKNKIKNYVSSIISDISGIDGKDTVKFNDSKFDFNKEIDLITNAIADNTKSVNKTVQEAYKGIVDKTKTAEHLLIKDEFFGSNLSDLLSNTIELGRRFKEEGVSKDMNNFTKNATKLINTKSVLGLAVVIPLAMSMQSINRWITKKTSGSEGAPIYKDFAKEGNISVEKDKENLTRNKLLAISGLLGITIASMAKMPTMSMFQFKGMFPTMDQCRWISASTFGSRMAVAEDNNELRETFIRDTITFASLYWLGDYASKLAAKGFETINPKIKLLNHCKQSAPSDNFIKKTANWIKNVHLKSFDEVASVKNVKNIRTACQLAGFGFSTLVLGLLLPKYTRMQTEKKEREFKLKLAQQNAQNIKNFFNYQKNDIPEVFQKFSGLQNVTKR